MRALSACPLCVMCSARGRISAATEVDHIMPLYKGGTDDDANLQPLCHDCHANKTRADKGHRHRAQIGSDGYPIEW